MFNSADIQKLKSNNTIEAAYADDVIRKNIRDYGPARVNELRTQLQADAVKRKSLPVYEQMKARMALPLFVWGIALTFLGAAMLAAFWKKGLGFLSIVGGLLILMGAVMAVIGFELGKSHLPANITETDRLEAVRVLQLAGEESRPTSNGILRYSLGGWLVLEVALAASLCATLFLAFLPFSGAIAVSLALGVFLAVILHRFAQRIGHQMALDNLRATLRNLHRAGDPASHQKRDEIWAEFGSALGYDYSEEASNRVRRNRRIYTTLVIVVLILVAIVRMVSTSHEGSSTTADFLLVLLLGSFAAFVLLANPYLAAELESVAGIRGERATAIVGLFPSAAALADFRQNWEQDVDDWFHHRWMAIDREAGAVSFGVTATVPTPPTTPSPISWPMGSTVRPITVPLRRMP